MLTTATLRRHWRGAQTSLTYTLRRTQRPAASSLQQHRTCSCALLRQHGPRARSCNRPTSASSSQVRHRTVHATAPVPLLWTSAAPGVTWDTTASSDDALVCSSAHVHMCACLQVVQRVLERRRSSASLQSTEQQSCPADSRHRRGGSRAPGCLAPWRRPTHEGVVAFPQLRWPRHVHTLSGVSSDRIGVVGL